MTCRIEFSEDVMMYIALFESITNASVKDCIVDEDHGCVLYIVDEGQIGMAIGKGGRNIRTLDRMTGKKNEIVEYAKQPAQFIKNVLKPATVEEVRMTKRRDGKTTAVVTVDPKDKGVAIGKDGRKAERARFLAKRHFQIQNISIE